MCDLVENYANKKAAEAAAKAAAEAATKAATEATAKAVAEAAEEAKASALRLFQNGASYELVRTSIISLTDKELQEIYKKAMEE